MDILLEVNPSRVVHGMWCSLPGVRPGLLEVDTPSVGIGEFTFGTAQNH